MCVLYAFEDNTFVVKLDYIHNYNPHTNTQIHYARMQKHEREHYIWKQPAVAWAQDIQSLGATAPCPGEASSSDTFRKAGSLPYSQSDSQSVKHYLYNHSIYKITRSLTHLGGGEHRAAEEGHCEGAWTPC